jgi:hypothetical protein
MAEKWTASMDGMPWTKRKMKEAVKILRPGASVTFAFGAEKLTALQELNEEVFKPRPDLVFHAWSVTTKSIITDEELQALISMNHIKKVQLNGFNNTSLAALGGMHQLDELILGTDKKLDLSFVRSLSNLQKIRLSGVFSEIGSLAECVALEKVSLSTTITSFDFLRPLTRLTWLNIDSCAAPADLKPFNHPSLTDLSISAVHNMQQVDDLAAFESLQKLHLHAVKLEMLPHLRKLTRLHTLKLAYMKSLRNPEALQALPELASLELTEINTKLKAEQFYFLFDMPSLKKLDYRFMDFNKKRIETLNNECKKRGREDLLES